MPPILRSIKVGTRLISDTQEMPPWTIGMSWYQISSCRTQDSKASCEEPILYFALEPYFPNTECEPEQGTRTFCESEALVLFESSFPAIM